jgi:tetratricopeptide (TPR) repeat protein
MFRRIKKGIVVGSLLVGGSIALYWFIFLLTIQEEDRISEKEEKILSWHEKELLKNEKASRDMVKKIKCYWRENNQTAALNLFKTLLEVSPGAEKVKIDLLKSPIGQELTGGFLELLPEELSQGIEMYIAKKFPLLKNSFSLVGQILFLKRNNLCKARRELEKGVITRAVYLARLGRAFLKDALTTAVFEGYPLIEKAHQLEPSNPEISLYLAEAYLAYAQFAPGHLIDDLPSSEAQRVVAEYQNKALEIYQKIVQEHPQTPWAPQALEAMGNLYRYRFRDLKKASEIFKRLEREYPEFPRRRR